MGKKFTNEQKISICKEFTESNSSQREFVKIKNISMSSLNRWLSKFRDKKISNHADKAQKFTSISVENNITKLEPIQIVLNSGIKLNLPPNFCNKSLELILCLLGIKNA